MNFIEADKVAAIAAVESKIVTELAMADRHEREAAKLRSELDRDLSEMTEKQHGEMLDKIASAGRAAERAKAKAAAMRKDRDAARHAELEARRPGIEAAVLENAARYRETYNSLVAQIIGLLTEAKTIDDAVEVFNCDSAGTGIPTLRTIEGSTRRQNGRLPRSLYGQTELPSFDDGAPLRVPGTHSHSF